MKGANLSASLVTRLRENTSAAEGLHYFDICNSNVGPAEISALGDCIKYNGNNCEGMAPLIVIDLSSNSICGASRWGQGSVDVQGLEDFCGCLTAISKVSRLRKLTFNKNILDTAGFATIGTLLSNGPQSILELSLRGCGGTAAGLDRLADGLKNNKALQLLDLRENAFGPDGVANLCEVLPGSARLKQLYLSGCGLLTKGTSAVFHALHHNFGLEALSIGDNDCGDSAGEAIAGFLRANQKLRSLDISENGIGLDGITAIAKGLSKNRTLVFLGLQWNDIDNEGAHLLAEVLATNSTLRSVHIVGTAITEEGIHDMVDQSLLSGERQVDIDVNVHYRPARRRPLSRQSVDMGAAEALQVATAADGVNAAASAPMSPLTEGVRTAPQTPKRSPSSRGAL